MRKLGKAQKIRITCAILCCALLAIVFSADYKKLFASVTDALNALTGTEATMTVDSMVVMNTEDAQQTDDYYAFGVYAPNAATYTIGVTAENGKMRINTGEAIAVDGTEVSVSLTEGTNVLYFVDCENPSIQWDSENCDLEPVNKVCMPLSGDVNQSENRTVEDLVRIKKEAQEAGSGNIERTAIADIDGDDSVTNEDASLLRTLMVGNPGYEVAERHGLIVDAYIEETGTLYDTLAEAVEAASAISVSDSKSVTVTVLNPTDVKLTAQIPVQGGAQIILQDDGTKDSGWSRTITRGSEEAFKMFTVADATLTLTGSSGSDEYSSLILDGGAIANAKNHIVDVGWTPSTAKSGTLTMNAGVKLTNNINSGSNSGGGALAIRYTFNMNGGIISGNINAGNSGAINLGTSGTTMNMTGGIITENETRTDIYSAGGVNISNGATLIMTGGEIYGNIAPDSVGGNSVRKSSETSTLQMGGSAYIDRVCFDSTSVDTHCMELTSKLTTDKKITLFFTQPLSEANAVIKRDSSCAENDSLFALSERMLPCKLVQDDSNENLCLRSNTTDMGKVTAKSVYRNENAFEGINNEWVVQGACADDTYLYAAIAHNVSGGHKGCKLLKVNLATWETVAVSEILPTDHSNEMTFNRNTNRIYITHCSSSGEFESTTGINKDNGPYAISVVNPDTLTLDTTVGENGIIKLASNAVYTGVKGISALAYNATEDYYVANGTGFRFGFLKGATNNEGNYAITECAIPSTGLAGFIGYTGYTKQGVYATDTTIYSNTWYDITNIDDEEQNFITMYDWNGNYNGTKLVVNENGTDFIQEMESMFEYNGKMYVACFPTSHTGVEIFELSDIGTAQSTIDVKNANGTVVDGVYTNLADAVAKANELGTATIVLKDDVTIGSTQNITGNVTITDDGTKRTLQRSTGCTAEMFNVAGGATLTFTSTSEDDNNPMLVIDGNKENVETSGYAPVVDMDQTDGILNITPGVIVQNNKSHASGGIIFAGKNAISSAGGGQATINITGGLFTGNEIKYSSSQYLFGGCIYIESGCTLNISNATFENTKMTQDATGGMTYGGVISARTSTAQQNGDKGASITLEDCVFKNTSVTQKGSASANGGGVLYLRDQNPGSVQIINCEFLDNSTKGSGGAIYMGNTKTPIELSGSSFSNNTDANGTNDIYMVASTNINVSGDTQANIYCAGQKQIHIAEIFGTESVIKVTVPDTATAGITVATFASEDIMTACKENRNIVLSESSYALSYDATNLNATLVDAVAVVEDSGYASLAEAIDVASTMTSDADNPVVIKLISDTVAVDSKITIPEGIFVEIIDDGMQRTLQRASGCTAEMFNVEGGAGLTFTSSSKDDSNPMLVIDGNKANVTTSGTSPIVKMNNTNGILNITPGVIVQNNKSANAGAVIYAGANSGGSSGGGLAIINITGGLFTGNKIVNTGQWIFGGCIYIESGCTLNIHNATFNETTMETTHKSGYTYGGVISVRTNAAHPYDGADVSIENCIFENTTATQKGSGNGGGVLYIGGGNPGTVQITNCTFSNNTTDGLGGAIHTINTDAAFNLFGCSFSNNADANGANDIHMVEGTNVNISGNTQANLHCVGTGKMNITGDLGIDSVINVSVSNATVGNTVATFTNAELLNACKNNRNIVLSGTSYALSYDATNLKATLESAVAVVEDRGYLSLAEAIEVANALESATIVLKADVTVGETQTITGNVTITDDGTARLLTRGERLTNAMFDIVDTDKDTGNLTIVGTQQGTITVDGNRDVVTATDSMIKNDGTFTLGTNASLTNAGNTNVEKGGALYNTGTATLAGTLSGNKANQGGALYSEEGTVTISGGTFELNSANQGGVVYTAIGATLNITGGTFGTEGKGNTSTYRAGVVYVQESTSTEEIASATISNATFSYNVSNNSTGASGGVLYVGTYADVEIAKCTFNNNSVTCSKSGLNAYGGAIYVTDANVCISDSWFSNNNTERGGAVYIAKTSELTLHNCEFEDNAATNLGRDIFYDNGKLTLSGKVGNAQIDKRQHTINVVGELDSTSDIEIMQVSGTIGLAQVKFDSAAATEIGAQCISYYNYYNDVNSGLKLQFDTENYQAIMK